MKITKQQLRSIIRESLLLERDPRLRGAGENPAEFDAKEQPFAMFTTSDESEKAWQANKCVTRIQDNELKRQT